MRNSDDNKPRIIIILATVHEKKTKILLRTIPVLLINTMEPKRKKTSSHVDLSAPAAAISPDAGHKLLSGLVKMVTSLSISLLSETWDLI